MLLRFLAITLVVYLGWRGLRQLLAPPGGGPNAPGPSPRTSVQETLVACDRCGVLIPESRALRQGDARLCSPTCRDGGPA